MTVTDQSAELVITVRLTKSDISECVKLRAFRSPFFWIIPLWAVIMIEFTLSSTLHTPRSYGWASGLIGGMLSLIFLLRRSSASMAKQPGALAPMKFEFSAYGITADFENGTNKAMWSLVKGTRETAPYFFIEMQRRSFHLIPKRLLTEEQTSRLREILRAHISKNIELLG
jgi:hypothetical protein